MKNFPNKIFLWGVTLLSLQNEWGAFAQPIQLIPQGGKSVEQTQTEDSLSSFQNLADFWEGTPPTVVEIYFPTLPLKLTSPTLRGLRTQLAKEKYTPLLQNSAYEKSLLSLLIEGGEEDQAKEFLTEMLFPEKESLLLDFQWLAGDTKKACEKVTNLIRTSPHLEWKQQNIYCLFLNGEKERAKIAAEILSESNAHATQFLNVLFDPTFKMPLDESLIKSPFLLNVWIEAQHDISEIDLNKLPSSSLALIARSEKVLPQARLLVGEKALQQGTLKGEEFLNLVIETPKTVFWGNILHELASGKTDQLLPFLERSEKEGTLSLLPQVFHAQLSSLHPSSETLPLAPFIIRAFLQSEHKDVAKKWGTFFMREAPDEAISVLPFLHLAFPDQRLSESQIQAWQAYNSRVHPERAVQHSYELRRILEAFKEPSGKPMKGEPSSPSWRQEKALFDEKLVSLLESAADSQRKGEVLLFVLIMIGEKPLHEFSVDKLAPILKALHRAGYKKEARELALEFLLTRGG